MQFENNIYILNNLFPYANDTAITFILNKNERIL